jgi:hypothetical protein
MPLPRLLRLTHDQSRRLERLAERCDMSRHELIERLMSEGLAHLEHQRMLEDPGRPRAESSIDQRLRESGLGA